VPVASRGMATGWSGWCQARYQLYHIRGEVGSVQDPLVILVHLASSIMVSLYSHIFPNKLI
jgi:hypothetical protein